MMPELIIEPENLKFEGDRVRANVRMPWYPPRTEQQRGRWFGQVMQLAHRQALIRAAEGNR
jgi:hypothetical protein